MFATAVKEEQRILLSFFFSRYFFLVYVYECGNVKVMVEKKGINIKKRYHMR